MVRRLFRQLRSETRGATIIEFAIVAPVMCVLLCGGLDLAHTLYVQAALEGAVQKAARDSALESGVSRNVDGAIDAKVGKQVHELVRTATFEVSRRYYRTFNEAAAAQYEPFTDGNGDHLCNNGEPFHDLNNNKIWDKDGADAGQGGAKDRTVYKVTIEYDRLFPLMTLFGLSKRVHMEATTILANQPFADQAAYTEPKWENCPE